MKQKEETPDENVLPVSSSFFLFYAFVFNYPSVCNQTKNAVEQDQEMKDNMIQIGDQAFVAHRKDAH